MAEEQPAGILFATACTAGFYQDIFELDVLMDLGWIATYRSRQLMSTKRASANTRT